MRTRCRVALVATLLAAVPVASGAQATSERDVLDLITRDGPQALAIRAAAEIAVAEHAARLALPNPLVSYAREGAGFTEFYQVEQLLPAFGVRGALQRAGVAAREAAAAERDARLWRLRSDARELIARHGAAAERLQAAQLLVSLVDKLIEALRAREREGEGSRFDRLRAEQDLVEARQAATDALVELSAARGAITALLPRGAAVPQRFAAMRESGDPEPVEALVARAGEARAELRALQSAAQRFRSEAEAAARATGPAPNINAGLKRADDQGERRAGAIVGIGVTVPLFNRGPRQAARWHAEQVRADLEYAAIDADIRSQVANAIEALTLRRQASGAAVAALAAADDLITIADVAYREGDIGILQLLDAYRTAGRARERAVSAGLDVHLAQIALERAVGVSLWP